MGKPWLEAQTYINEPKGSRQLQLRHASELDLSPRARDVDAAARALVERRCEVHGHEPARSSQTAASKKSRTLAGD